MELDDVRAFVRVADTGSVSEAARDLHVTQSAITRRLQRLEISLGATLLNRGTRPVQVTAVGQSTLPRCRRLLNEAREVRAAAANNDFSMGEIRIGVAHALTEITLTHPVDLMRRKFPNVGLRLGTGWSRDLLEGVRSGVLDSAVILLPEGEPLPPEVSGAKLGKERLVIVGSRGKNPARARKVQDLAGKQWILNPEGCAARAALRRALLRENIDMIVGVEAYNYELQLALVAQNRGFSLVPERILARSRVRSHLRTLQVAGLSFPLIVWIVHGQSSAGFDRVLAELRRALAESL